MTSILVDSPAQTESLGRRLGESMFPGAVVALIGPLGAGKTYLVRSIAEGMGIGNPAVVSSPTFVLIQEYEARLPIYHFDAYRLSSARQFVDLGVHEYYEAGGICLIEWADRVAEAVPAEHLRIEMEPLDECRRQIHLSAFGEAHRQLLAAATASYNTL